LASGGRFLESQPSRICRRGVSSTPVVSHRQATSAMWSSSSRRPTSRHCGKSRAPALQLGKVELHGVADHMQARLANPTRQREQRARTPVPHQRCGRELHLRAAKQHECRRTARAQAAAVILATRARNPLAWSWMSVFMAVMCLRGSPLPTPSPPLSRGERVGVRRDSGSATFANSAHAIGKCLCVSFSICPPPNLPVNGGGVAAPSPRAARVGVGVRCLNLFSVGRKLRFRTPNFGAQPRNLQGASRNTPSARRTTWAEDYQCEG
jgi:hypothetical protein